MLFVLAFGFMALAFLALFLFERHKRLKVKSDDSDIAAIFPGMAYGATVGQAQMAKMGIQPDEITQREDIEFKKFKFDD